MAGLAGSGAAKRRRERQLQAWHRHVRTTVAMELATALHHSTQRVEGPREGEVHAKHEGLRAQKRLLPGTRPSPAGAQAAGEGSNGRLRGCPGASPHSTVAGGHCSRSSGLRHGAFPPPGRVEEV